MTAKQINLIIKLDVRHVLYRSNGYWYHHLNSFPSALFDMNGYIIFKSRREYLRDPKLQHGDTLHVAGGICNLKGFLKYTEKQKKALNFNKDVHGVEEEVIKKIRKVQVALRRRELVKKIKDIYKYTCQLCKIKLKVRDGLLYSEAHHIRPLGSFHKGPDIIDNMLCVCPNCHVLLDLGAVKIEIAKLLVKHTVGKKFIAYHNTEIFKGSLGNLQY